MTSHNGHPCETIVSFTVGRISNRRAQIARTDLSSTGTSQTVVPPMSHFSFNEFLSLSLVTSKLTLTTDAKTPLILASKEDLRLVTDVSTEAMCFEMAELKVSVVCL